MTAERREAQVRPLHSPRAPTRAALLAGSSPRAEPSLRPGALRLATFCYLGIHDTDEGGNARLGAPAGPGSHQLAQHGIRCVFSREIERGRR